MPEVQVEIYANIIGVESFRPELCISTIIIKYTIYIKYEFKPWLILVINFRLNLGMVTKSCYNLWSNLLVITA